MAAKLIIGPPGRKLRTAGWSFFRTYFPALAVAFIVAAFAAPQMKLLAQAGGADSAEKAAETIPFYLALAFSNAAASAATAFAWEVECDLLRIGRGDRRRLAGARLLIVSLFLVFAAMERFVKGDGDGWKIPVAENLFFAAVVAIPGLIGSGPRRPKPERDDRAAAEGEISLPPLPSAAPASSK